LVLYDVSTLYFETDTGDGFREPGFSKERRLEPQITIGLLTDAAGFPLMVNAFEGNTAETTAMLPTIQAFMKAHQLADVTVVADAGMVSAPTRRPSRRPGCRSFSVPVSPRFPTWWPSGVVNIPTRTSPPAGYRTIQIQAGTYTITAADPLPADLHQALDRIHSDPSAH
jgi:hypothetical protein